MKRTLILSAALLAVAFLTTALPGAAVASPPSNDDFANAIAIDPSSLPFTDTVSVVEAAYESGESGNCGVSNTVWYSFTPTVDGFIRVNPSGSTFSGVVLNAYRQDATGISGLTELVCSIYGDQLQFSVLAGKTYYIQAGSSYWAPGDLHLVVAAVPPPVNDNFADAVQINGLPFSSASVDATAATLEANEPLPSCVSGLQTGTAWYKFTPSETASISATGAYYGVIAAYTGSNLGVLSQVGCGAFGQPVTFRAKAGTAYYFQLAGLFGNASVLLQLVTTPPPNAAFGFNPGDPNSFDTIQFYDQSYDPGGLGFSGELWTFGDGSSSTNPGCCPTHRYLADGDYKVELNVTTPDGRTTSTIQTVHVRTHDVAIVKIGVPQSANVGQTRSISIGISNKRYAENVQVQLYKSGPNGFELVGTLQQNVPVRNGGRTTDFNFSYTFTSADKSLGKVTFKAVASLIGARDALPADNEVVALPTKVG